LSDILTGATDIHKRLAGCAGTTHTPCIASRILILYLFTCLFSVYSISGEDPPTDRLATILLNTMQFSYRTDIWKWRLSNCCFYGL